MVGVDGNFHYPAHLVALLALLTTLSVTNIRAQPVSSLGLRALSGHVYDTRSRPIGGALVIASDALGVGVDSATTDNLGDYHLSIPQEQVLLTVSAIGYATARKIVPGSVTTENVVMRSLVSALAPIRVTASREIRARPADVLAAGTAALENATSGAAGNLAPASFGGNILGKAELVPGMMLQRNATGQIQGVSVLGLSSDQSSVTFDGVLTNNPRIPRDADLAVRVSSSTYDPSRGGFSGAQVEVTTGSGSNISTRYLDVSQSKEVLNRAPTGVFDISGTASGALSLDHIFYSGSMELSEQRAELNSFGSTNSSGLSAADLSHLSAALVRLGLNAPQLSNVQRARTGIALGRLDFVRDTNLSVAVEGHASADAIEPEASSSFVAPTVFGRNSDMDVGISGSITHYIGESLHESRVGVGRSSETVLPYMRAPTYNIRVLQDGPTLDDRRSVIAGSASDHRSSSDRFTATLEHSVRWLPSSRHYLHAGITSHFTSVRRTPQANSLGRFTFDSVGAFVTGNASSYSRMFGAIAEAARTASVGGFVGDLWIPRPRMSVQLGSRFDADRVMIPGGGFASAPPPILRGAASTQVTSFDLSPRLGMTVDEPISHRFPIAGLTFRGGAGRFVNEPRPEQFLNASIPVTGPHAGSELDCAGLTTHHHRVCSRRESSHRRGFTRVRGR